MYRVCCGCDVWFEEKISSGYKPERSAMAPRVSVTLHVYDLSQGMARQFSPMILGKEIGGIWHTGIVVFGTEYYFGGGICADPPCMTPYGAPVDTVSLGSTVKSMEEFRDFLRSISSRFSMSTYHVLDNNCNNVRRKAGTRAAALSAR